MAEDLFGAALAERLRKQAPLAARMRPATLDEVVGQGHLLGPGGPLRRLIEADRMSSVILWGPPGTGKTTLAKLIAASTERAFETLSAVTAGVKDVREVVARAKTRLAEQGQGTILFLDFTAHSLGVRVVRSWAVGAVWDTPLRGLCTPHLRRDHGHIGTDRRPPGAARESSRRAALVHPARHGHGLCPRPS
jgi:hypothetical protein